MSGDGVLHFARHIPTEVPVSTDHVDSENTREQVVQDPAGTTYRIRAVKKGMPLRGDITGVATGPLDFVVQFLLDTVLAAAISLRASRQDTWKLGVYRQTRAATERLAHKELLAPGDAPEERISTLRQRIAAGDTSTLSHP